MDEKSVEEIKRKLVYFGFYFFCFAWVLDIYYSLSTRPSLSVWAILRTLPFPFFCATYLYDNKFIKDKKLFYICGMQLLASIIIIIFKTYL